MSLLSQNLQALVAVVNHGTVHGAAKELGLTQTGVTQRIRGLEKELETTLFLRSRKGMRLTREGEALHAYCRGATDLEGYALSQIQGAGKTNRVSLTLVGPTSVMTSRVTPQCLPLYISWPQLHLNLVISDLAGRIGLVQSGKAALAIVPTEDVPDEMDSKVLKPEEYLLVATSHWKGRRLSELLEKERLIDFNEMDQTSVSYLRHFQLGSPVNRFFVNSNESLIRLFAAGAGFGTLTREVAQPFLRSGELIALNKGMAKKESLALAWYPRPMMPDYFKALVQRIH